MKYLFGIFFFFVRIMSFRIVGDDKGGTGTKSLDEQIADSLTRMNERLGKLGDMEKSIAENKAGYEQVTKVLEEMKGAFIAIQRQQLAIRSARIRRGGEVSLECAKHLGAMALVAGVRQGYITGEERIGNVVRTVKSILNLELKAALTTAEIPLPDEYSAEVVELVSEYGQARRYGTVYPLGGGSVKLPKLKTSPAFGLIAMSAQIAQKAPAFEFVTFAAEKWGGVVVLPNEIDADSVVALGMFVARYSAREMAKVEDVVFFTADGTATYASLKGLLLQQDVAATRVVMAAGKTKLSDLTLANARAMRAKVASAALGRGAYYFHPSFEQLFSSFNTAGDKPYIANGINGASLDGFPIRWIDTLPAYSEVASVDTLFGAFGDASFSYLGVRGSMSYDTSKEFLFDLDQTAVRALERFTVGHMAADHCSVVKTAAA